MVNELAKPFVDEYRPKLFDNVIGEHNQQIAKILKSKLEENKLPKVIMFNGPTGTGKTTLALIIARLTTTEPDSDIIEMNMSDKTGIDAIRELNESYVITPMDGNGYKTYVMDEVHNCSKQAQDGLLKILERGPRRTRFILCTDSPEKLDKALVKRCQVYKTQRPSNQDIYKLLVKIVQDKKIPIEPDALKLLTEKSSDVRNAIHNLESLIGAGKIDVALVNSMIEADMSEDSDYFLLTRILIWPEMADHTKQINEMVLWEIAAPVLEKCLEKIPAQNIAINIAGYCRTALLQRKYKTTSKGVAKNTETQIREFTRLQYVLEIFGRDLFMAKPENTLVALYWRAIVKIMSVGKK